MSNVNKVVITGNVGKDIELITTKNGNHIVEFSLAVTKHKLDQAGQFNAETNWFSVKAFGRLAERLSGKIGKGSKVALVGELSTENWTDQATGAKRSKVVIIVESVENLSPKQMTAEEVGREYAEGVDDSSFDDIPFDEQPTQQVRNVAKTNGARQPAQYQGRPTAYQASNRR